LQQEAKHLAVHDVDRVHRDQHAKDVVRVALPWAVVLIR
jgi:hypothetical protein